MNKLFFSSIVFSLTSIILTGCQGAVPASSPEVDQAATTEAGANVQKEVLESGFSTAELIQWQSKLSDIVSSDKLERCAELDNDKFEESCNYHILANRALKADDASICDQGTTPEIIRLCHNELKSDLSADGTK